VVVSESGVVTTGGRVYLVQVGVALAASDTVLRRYRDLLLWSLPPVLVAAGLAAWGVAAVALAPLVRRGRGRELD
jgi:hypothetical protein